LDEHGTIMWHIRGDVTNESRYEAQRHERDGCQSKPARASSRAHSCAEVEVATGAGSTDSVGGNGCSSSSVLLIESALSRTGLIGAFAGEVDSVCWLECDEACGMLRLGNQHRINKETTRQHTSPDWGLRFQQHSVDRRLLWT
jgi:hypothetical protein